MIDQEKAKAKRRRHYIKHQERIKSERRRRYAANREREMEWALSYQRRNADKVRAWNKVWARKYYQEHKEQIKQRTAAWYRANRKRAREKQSVSSKIWWAANPHKRREYNHKRRAKVKAVGGSFNAATIETLISMQRGKCAYCQQKVGRKYQIDHITPVELDGTNDPINLQILCKSCNLKKWKHDPLDFARSIGLLL